jgi:hypothetical protein
MRAPDVLACRRLLRTGLLAHARVCVCVAVSASGRGHNDARLKVVNGQRRLVVGDGAVKVALPAVHVMIMSHLSEQRPCLPSG